MSLMQVRREVRKIVSDFFSNGTVLWAEQVVTKPKLPYITLKTGSLTKTAFPVQDDTLARWYSCKTVLELNVYTQGRKVGTDENAISNYENTSVDDLADFVIYLESDEIQDVLAKLNISLSLKGDIRDMSVLMNDTKYRYRALAEFELSWTEKTSGAYGIGEKKQLPNYSGGGNDDLMGETNLLERVEIKEE